MKFALISIFLLASFAVASSRKCYECSDCSGNGKEKDCVDGADKCLKIYVKADGKESTGRSCTNQLGCDLAKAVCKAAKDAKKDAECEAPCCDTDLCNSGAAPSFSVFLVSLCSLFAVAPFFK